LKKVLVPVDYSEPSAEVLQFGAEIASRLGGSLTVMHVWECMPHAPSDLMVKGRNGKLRRLDDVIRENAENEMQQFLESASLPSGLRVETKVVSGEAAQCILRELGTGGHDLLVMGTHGRGGVKQLVLGSVAEKMVRTSPVPVLVVPGEEEDDA
jgi:nucleotide-binding universal stress UspA family protein